MTEPQRDPGHEKPAEPQAIALDGTKTHHPQVQSTGREAVGDPANYPVPSDLLDHPRYRILAHLGSGGMGTVYKAEHRLMHRLVALKMIRPELLERPAMVVRFRKEVRAAARLPTPTSWPPTTPTRPAARISSSWSSSSGMDLDRLAKERGPLPVGVACDYARQAACGLQHAYGHAAWSIATSSLTT